MTKYYKQKHCKRCKKLLQSHNKSGYCRHCYIYVKNKEIRKRLRKEGKCLSCGKKVEPIVITPYRCKKCTERHKETWRENKEEKNEEVS